MVLCGLYAVWYDCYQFCRKIDYRLKEIYFVCFTFRFVDDKYFNETCTCTCLFTIATQLKPSSNQCIPFPDRFGSTTNNMSIVTPSICKCQNTMIKRQDVMVFSEIRVSNCKKNKHEKAISKHRSSTNRMSNRQNKFPTIHYP